MPKLENYDTLLAFPAETLAVEYKSWLDLGVDKNHDALIAKAIIALANHGGGHIVVGFVDDGSPLKPDPARPANVKAYGVDKINAIVLRYLEPAIHCDVVMAKHPDSGDEYPIIRVPPGSVPVRTKRASPDGRILDNVYFIRRPGPRSEPPATGKEWSDLLTRCLTTASDDLLDRLRIAIAGGSATEPEPSDLDRLAAWDFASRVRYSDVVAPLPADHNGRFPLGDYSVTYTINGDISTPSLTDLREIVQHGVIRHTGWPQFYVFHEQGLEPKPVGQTIEASFAGRARVERADNCDYWRASQHGEFFLIKGLIEDAIGPPHGEPGKIFDITSATWRVGEALLHAASMAAGFGDASARIVLQVRWSGLKGRKLGDLSGTRIPMSYPHVTHDDVYVGRIEVEADKVADALPELVDQVVRPLYERFDFFALPKALTTHELAKMRATVF